MEIAKKQGLHKVGIIKSGNCGIPESEASKKRKFQILKSKILDRYSMPKRLGFYILTIVKSHPLLR